MSSSVVAVPAVGIQLHLRTFDGSISMLDNADPKGPVMLYDAQDGRMTSHDGAYEHGGDRAPLDKPILGVARLDDPNDKYAPASWPRPPTERVRTSQWSTTS